MILRTLAFVLLALVSLVVVSGLERVVHVPAPEVALLIALYGGLAGRGTPAGAWLDNLHRAMDEAVAAAYGWPADLAESEVLSRLLSLNHARAPTAGAGRQLVMAAQ